MKILVFAFLILFLGFEGLQAQEISKKYQIVLKDGNVLKGKLLEINKTFWVLETETLGIIEIPFENIKSFEILDKNQEVTDNSSNIDKTASNAYNPVPERYLFMPSAIPLEAKKGNYSFLLLFTGVHYGFTEKFSAGINFFAIPIPFFLSNINFKFSHSFKPNIHLALQANNFLFYETLFSTSLDLIHNPNLLITLGNKRQNITLGAGTFFSFIYPDFRVNPFFQVSAVTPLNWRTFLVTQNFYLDFSGTGLLSNSLAVRLARKNKVYDLGVTNFTIYDYGDVFDSFPAPYVGIQISLGKK